MATSVMTNRTTTTSPSNKKKNYWEWEESFDKTLSSASLTGLEKGSNQTTHDVEEKKEVKQQEKQVGKKKVNYWNWTEAFQKTLSSASLTQLEKGSNRTAHENEETTTNNGNDVKKETTTTTVSTTTTESNNNVIKEKKKGKSYWEWTEGFQKTLSSASLTQLQKGSNQTNRDGQEEEVEDNKEQEKKEEEEEESPNNNNNNKKGGYWFWFNPQIKNMSSSSLDKLSTEHVVADDNNENKEETTPKDDPKKKNGSLLPAALANMTKPITMLEHKQRSTWRRSFQHLSSNSLTKLAEEDSNTNEDAVLSRTPPKSAWRDSFRTFRESFHNMTHLSHTTGTANPLHAEEDEHQQQQQADDDDNATMTSEDGITF